MRPMVHPDDEAHAGHPAPAAEARFDVRQVLAVQREKKFWDGGPVTVSITTVGAGTGGSLTYVSFEQARLIP